MKMISKVLSTLVLVFVATTSAEARHNILGTTYGFDGNNYTVVHSKQDYWNQNTWLRLVQNTKTNRYHIEFSGRITQDAVTAIEGYLKDAGTYMSSEHNLAISVYLNSGGGDAEAGLALNKLFQGWKQPGQRYSVSAAVTGNQTCASACAIAFMGAKFRNVFHNGKLKFHASYTTSQYGVKKCDTNPYSDFNIRLKKAISVQIGMEKGQRLFKETNKCKVGNNLITYSKYSKWLLS